MVTQWWELAWYLVAKYSDGYITTGEQPQDVQLPGYPSWWLHLTEFSAWPGTSFTPKTEPDGTHALVVLVLSSVILAAFVLRAYIYKPHRAGYTMLP